MTADALIPPGAARAIVGGDCGDPFAHLGMHRRSGALIATAFLPEAARASLPSALSPASRSCAAVCLPGFQLSLR